jgi:UDP-N-acetylmuramate dehydrogenase
MAAMATDPRPFDAVSLGTEIQRRLGVKTSRDEPLARFTTMRVGGPADLFAVAHNGFELRGLIKFARARGVPHALLGRGSNVVIADAGFRGLVIQDRAEGADIRDERLIAEAGLPMARAATLTQEAGLTGLEFGLAIPGTVGGAIWANAGAHEADVAAVLESATVLLADGTERRMPAAELGLAYRESRFKAVPGGSGSAAAVADRVTSQIAGPAEVVLGATFLLGPADPATIRQRLDDIRRWRQAHQPLGIPSAGSVFRNPPGDRSAGAIVDELGLKGLTEGGATISPKHANFIVNDRKGSAADVRRLADRVRAEVWRQAGIELVFEIVFLGDWSDWPPGRAGSERASTAVDAG